jgi:hypothetical protein
VGSYRNDHARRTSRSYGPSSISRYLQNITPDRPLWRLVLLHRSGSGARGGVGGRRLRQPGREASDGWEAAEEYAVCCCAHHAPTN